MTAHRHLSAVNRKARIYERIAADRRPDVAPLTADLVRCSGFFMPGIEVNMADVTADKINDPDKPNEKGLLKTKPGELTQKLCSPWQFDFQICRCSYWPAQRPDTVTAEDGTTGVNWIRTAGGEMSEDDMRDHWQKLCFIINDKETLRDPSL